MGKCVTPSEYERGHLTEFLRRRAASNVSPLVFETIMEGSTEEPDKGNEFDMKNVQVQSHETHWLSFESELKAQIVGRFNRTLREGLRKYFTHYNTKRRVDVLPSFVDKSNNSHHRSIKMKPIEGSKKGNENKVYTNLFPDVEVQIPSISKFNVEDFVRINNSKGVFDEGYLSSYTTEVFQIAAVKHTTPITYELSDRTGELIIVGDYGKPPKLIIVSD
ncbi:hypothetical protein QYM36_003950 [Artemia franciscana]|uniref:Uncharacterized protein n=1 Tax=Artemia franciscana TaxID=6661 RepID=A0AA88I2R9_ARTSF|nr:hypothetical protein QYM36_003950 [Artemia franciscana]